MKLSEITQMVAGILERGSPDADITDVAGPYDAGPSEAAFISAAQYLSAFRHSKAGCVLAPPEVALDDDIPETAAVIRVQDAAVAFGKLVDIFAGPPVRYEPGIHATAVVSHTASIDPSASVGPLCIVCDGVAVGSGTVLAGGVFVGRDARIGSDCLIHPNVTLRERVRIGERVVIHSGTVVGSDGFGFETDENGRHSKIPQKGTVVVEDDVEIGACVAIDRARFAKTVIGRGTKIDNLVHIAHNVTIGENCLLVAQVGIAGSSHIGRSVILAGQAGVDGHLSVGDGARVAGKAGVTSDVEPGVTVAGYPAWPHMKEKRIRAASRKLPELLKDMENLNKRVEQLERASEDD
jgi:UDP-3-O-[3-hydroxymyristoyl] glucosamine N-acyltransferase